MSLKVFSDEEFALEANPLGDTISIEAEFSRYLYEHEDGNFSIAQLITNNYEEFVIKGNIPFTLYFGRAYKVTGRITEHRNNRTGMLERQLDLHKIITVIPEGEAQTVKFLATITGNLVAQYIYNEYEENTIETIRTNPKKVIKDFGSATEKAVYRLQREIEEALGEVSEAYPFLQGYRFTEAEVKEMVNRYGEEIIDMVKDNPYILMNYLDGFPGASFKRCDKIAKDVDYDLTDSRRIKGALEHILVQEGSFGHVYYHPEKLIYKASKVLNQGIDEEILKDNVKDSMNEMVSAKKLYLDKDNNRIYLGKYYYHETMLALNLSTLVEEDNWVSLEKRQAVLDEYLNEQDIHLEDKQREAVINLSRSSAGVGIINGGAGTGKTFTVLIFLELMERLYREVRGRIPEIQLMAPTGKAAKVMKNATGREATTIHRGLHWTPDGFTHNEGNPLTGDIVVIDEASMLDTSLAFSLTRAVNMGTKLVFLGDPNQLPSIGAGNVLHDMVNSGKFDTTTLSVMKRQENESQIAINGRLIAEKQLPQADKNCDNPKAITKTKNSPKDLVEQTMLAFNFLRAKDIAVEDIQIITPGRKGQVGVYNLNKKLQDVLNSDNSGMSILNKSFIVGGVKKELRFKQNDKVIHTTNTDELDWVSLSPKGDYIALYEGKDNPIITNGEIGKIVDIYIEDYLTRSGKNQKREVIIVKYDDGLLKYNAGDKRHLDHAYAMTIHKSQGSQWKAVIQLMSTEHYIMLDNSLLYTGYTRAEEYQILLTEPRAIEIAINTRKVFDRRTTLCEFIKNEVK